MIRYEVTLECSSATAPELERWMRNSHIPDMLATGCFAAIHFDADASRFRTVYQAPSQPHLDKYFAEFAERMQQDFRQQFPHGIAVSRDTWRQVQHWAPS